MSLSDAEQTAIDTLYRAFNVGDASLLDEVLAEDWQDTPMAPGQGAGRAGMTPMLEAFRAAFSELQFTAHETVGSSGSVAVRLTLSGRHVGEWLGVAATGRSFEIAMHELHHVRDGRITHTWHLEDWAGWRQQVGADEAPASAG